MGRHYGSDTKTSIELQKAKDAAKVRHDLFRKIINAVVPVVCISFLVFLIIFNIKVVCPDAEKQTEEATKQIESLRAEIKTIMEDKDINKIYIDPVTNNVHEAAATVCELQNKLSEYYYVTQKGNKKIEKVYGDALLSYGNYVSNMKRDIWADRFIDRYIKTTDTADEAPYIWVCDSDFTYEGSKTSVSWVCYDKSDTNKRNILSVVYADYDATTGIFTNVFQVMDKHASESLNRA